MKNRTGPKPDLEKNIDRDRTECGRSGIGLVRSVRSIRSVCSPLVIPNCGSNGSHVILKNLVERVKGLISAKWPVWPTMCFDLWPYLTCLFCNKVLYVVVLTRKRKNILVVIGSCGLRGGVINLLPWLRSHWPRSPEWKYCHWGRKRGGWLLP